MGIDTECSRSQELIPRNDILVVDFESHGGIFEWEFDREYHSPVERTFTALASQMNVCLLCFSAEGAGYEEIVHIAEIAVLCCDLGTAPDDDSDFVVNWRFVVDIELLVHGQVIVWDEIDPKSESSLRLLGLFG